MLVLGAGSRSGRPPLSPVASVVPSGRTRTPPALELGGDAERKREEKLLDKLDGVRALFCGLEFGMLNAAVEVADTPLGDRGGMGGNCDSVDETCVLVMYSYTCQAESAGKSARPSHTTWCGEGAHSSRLLRLIVGPAHSPACCRTLLTSISA